jgi:transcriptional regulator with XRE-family HTH domain
MITGAQIRMARGYLGWSAKQLADKAGVAESTIKRMEQDEGFPVARGANIDVFTGFQLPTIFDRLST